ncbi:MAG: hypothetical protein KC410_03380 [Anaerolineales bacterium]|uniref:PfkB family carbohydrate kinase n=1 Tax=Promineifilum sp. TaxID=2664178 RepID=UPI001D7990EF|nr:hypothetical protein [Anaerolineales bacterium]MCO5179497.1 PfkB family carbohydrate kinase [Promineifilum sp.]
MSSEAPAYPPVDFLAIGHICRDVVSGGFAIGGAAAYAASVAAALGCRAAIVTSATGEAEWSAELPGISVHRIAADESTIFENIYTPAGRIQIIHAVAGELAAGAVPPLWARAPVVFLGPIANEVDADIIHLFSNSIIGVGPQGWMRRWDAEGRVYQVEWESAAAVLPMAAVTFLSAEDLADPSLIDTYAHLTSLLIVTDGANGCQVYHQGDVRCFPAPEVPMVDTTGAGDIFAAAYLVRLYQTDGNFWEAAVFANRIAAHSVMYQGLVDKTRAIRQLLTGESRRAPYETGEG